jgi:hypothetical protein
VSRIDELTGKSRLAVVETAMLSAGEKSFIAPPLYMNTYLPKYFKLFFEGMTALYYSPVSMVTILDIPSAFYDEDHLHPC